MPHLPLLLKVNPAARLTVGLENPDGEDEGRDELLPRGV